MIVVRAAFSINTGDANFGIAKLSIVGRSLYSKLLCCISRRHIRSDYLVGIRCRCAWCAIDQKIAADTTRAAHCEVGNMCWLEGTVQTSAACIGNARCNVYKMIWITVDRWQFVHPLPIDCQTEVRI